MGKTEGDKRPQAIGAGECVLINLLQPKNPRAILLLINEDFMKLFCGFYPYFTML